MATPSSPRWDLVVERRHELLAIASEYCAGVALTGSVSRHEDDDDSDIDLYVQDFEPDNEGGPEVMLRATDFVTRIRACLHPFKVDVFPLPGRPLGPIHEMNMRRDAIPLDQLVVDDRR